MAQEERTVFASILTNLFVTLYFGSLIWGRARSGDFDGAEGLIHWARTVLWIIPVSVGITIVFAILFTIGYAIVTGQADPDTSSDERDRSISRFGMQVTMAVVSAGFIGTLVGIAFGWSALLALNLILLSFALGDLVGNLARIGRYRFWI